MTGGNIALYIMTALWVVLAWSYFLPVLSLPIARIKREFALTILVVGSLGILIEWLTRGEMHPVSIISLGAFVVIALVVIYLLRRMDYYVEELLQELFVLCISSVGISIATSVWYWGIDTLDSLLLVRILTGALPLACFAVSWFIGKQRYSLWSAIVYILLIAIKAITVPYWGIWSVILILLYSTLVGYVANWMTTTTYAEKILAWNVSPSKVWSVLVLSAGALVLFF